MVDDTVIVGSGFSAMVAYLCLKDAAVVVGATDKPKTQFRNQGFRYNKLLGTKASSYTKLGNSLRHSRLHDRLVQGGNGSVWGGFFNVNGIPPAQMALLENAGIVLMPLSCSKTGSTSLDDGIRQLQFASGETLNPAAIGQDRRYGFLERFEVLRDGNLMLYWSGLSGIPPDEMETSVCRKLILAIGVVQLIDLFYRSGYLKEQDVIGLSEFKYKLAFVSKKSRVPDGAKVIRVGLLRGLCHYLGVQHYPKFFVFADRFIPFVFDQIFQFNKNIRNVIIKNGTLTETAGEDTSPFGTSIHYCNVKINEVSANQFLKKISSRIVGLGMAFVDQESPGPISNDIFEDTVKKVWLEK